MTDVSILMEACGVNLVFNGDDDDSSSQKKLNIREEWQEIFMNTDMFALKQDEVQVKYRERLGAGAFCNVYPVHIRNGKTGLFNDLLPPFAIKQLNLDVTEHPRLLKEAHADLMHEAEILREAKHQNIVELIGIGDEAAEKKDFFIVTEKLAGTLESKLQKWAKIRGPFRQITPKDAVGLRISNVALQIASALGYLHAQNIIYRDLKPGNVGFDPRGNIKIFDFGLAVKVPEGKLIKGMAGTIRYMAPEMRCKNGVTRGKPYTFPVDVYSFAILLWEIITSRVPFEKDIPTSSFMEAKELPEDKRPNLKYVESKALQALLEASWATEPDDRWDFEKIVPELKKIGSDMINSPSKKRPTPGRKMSISAMNNY